MLMGLPAIELEETAPPLEAVEDNPEESASGEAAESENLTELEAVKDVEPKTDEGEQTNAPAKAE